MIFFPCSVFFLFLALNMALNMGMQSVSPTLWLKLIKNDLHFRMSNFYSWSGSFRTNYCINVVWHGDDQPVAL